MINLDPQALQEAAADLQEVETKDMSMPHIHSELDEQHIHDYQLKVLESNIERWLEPIQQYTFPTHMIPVTIADAQLLMQAHEEYKRSGQVQINDSLVELQHQLDQEIQQFAGKNVVFAKMSSRSAKDAITKNPRIQEFYWEEMKTLHEEEGQELNNDNTKIIAMFRAMSKALMMNNGEEILTIFIKSGRIYSDMSLALDHCDVFEENIVLRKWTNIDPSMEFRAFVNTGKLNAMCQYNYHVFYSELHENSETFLEKLVSFFEECIKPALDAQQIDSYIIDFGITENEDVMVIEINPFLPTTDAALFDWNKEVELLKNGPFEFRVRSKPPSGFKVRLTDDWRELVEAPLPDFLY